MASRAVTQSTPAGSDGRFASSGSGQIDTRTPSLGQSNRDGLFARSGTVRSLADVIYFFLDELTRLGRCGLALAFVGASPG
jgi:hypothetical protein